MPLQATSGAASYDAFGGGAAVAPKYIEDFFQTWLRTGTGSSATVTTGLNASINKSLVWSKSRSAATNHKLTDTVRGATKALSSNTSSAEATDSQGLTAFSSTGYTIGTNTDYNNSGATYVDWQWLATPKFFDVVTYTGDGANDRKVAHSLGSVPGCIIIKDISVGTRNWQVYHQSLGNTQAIQLNTTSAAATSSTYWNNTTPTATEFTLGTSTGVNASGSTYVAYLFAHNAGGFGLTGTDNVISCGSFTTDGSGNATVDLGYEPQYLLIKRTDSTSSWLMFDTMRGLSLTGRNYLLANTSGAEVSESGNFLPVTATGFQWLAWAGASVQTWAYIAIRRGPMKVPTTGTSVYEAVTYTGTGADITLSSSNVVDLAITMARTSGGFSAWDKLASTRLTGSNFLSTNLTDAEASNIGNVRTWNATQNSLTLYKDYASFATNFTYVTELFKRAPGFMDVVCYTGTGSARTVAHNLAAVPELMIVKRRNTAGNGWATYCAPLGNTAFLYVNSTGAADSGFNQWNNTSPTATQFSVSTSSDVNASGGTYVAYLFATCPGVSKVGSYTGTGATQVIDCGFTGGARFVLIKATSTTGDWYVWDTARGMIPANDPYLRLNSTAAEVTNTDWVDTAASGFELSNAGGNLANSSGVSYVFLAVA
jgi:hypothetical protein